MLDRRGDAISTAGKELESTGELTHREYTRTIDSENGTVNVQRQLTEIVVDSITILDRKKRKAKDEPEATA